MAIKLMDMKKLNALEVISEKDDAIDMDKSDWDKYLETCDTTHLVFKPNLEPTIFLCNFELKGKEVEYVKNAMIGGKDEDGSPKLAMGSWSQRVVKYVLRDVKNPSYLKEDERIIFKKDSGVYAHEETIALLEKLGIVNEIFAHYSKQVLSSYRANAKN
jgi:hypothetical protein